MWRTKVTHPRREENVKIVKNMVEISKFSKVYNNTNVFCCFSNKIVEKTYLNDKMSCCVDAW